MFLNVFHKTYNNFPMYGNLCKGGGEGAGMGKARLTLQVMNTGIKEAVF